MPLKRTLAKSMASAFWSRITVTRQNHWKIIGKTKKSGFCVVYSVLAFYNKLSWLGPELYLKWISQKQCVVETDYRISFSRHKKFLILRIRLANSTWFRLVYFNIKFTIKARSLFITRKYDKTEWQPWHFYRGSTRQLCSKFTAVCAKLLYNTSFSDDLFVNI